ncbi:MAG: 23S rRNA (uracil(1939)-C(5))-methyltransferase RlmD [Lachnospiraceae bacterium]|nr:23S rRNA (uracil(1939)-C(5))-methyltransferase RlmD [Lachnospiraceae bacterium]
MTPKKNEIVTLEITDIGSGGEGIGRADGFTLFVKGAVVGDVIEVRVLKAKKTYGYAKIERLLRPSANRVESVCPVAGRCGGCQLQQMSYEAQLCWKERKVKECLERIGGVEFEANRVVLPIMGMDEPFAYRNKAQFPVGKDKDGRIVTGFYAGHSHALIPSDFCAIQAPVNEVICRTVCNHMERYRIAPYDEETHTGLVRYILTRIGAATGEVLVCLIVNGKSLPRAEVLAERLKTAVGMFCCGETGNASGNEKTCDEANKADESGNRSCGKSEGEVKAGLTLKGVCLNVNCEITNVILGAEIIPVWGDTYITDYIGEVAYRISPLSFYQVNPKQTKVLYRKALEFAGLTGNEIVWDLYCGIGTISLFLAAKAKRVYGVEIVPQAIEDAKENAVRNGITNAEFFVGAAEDVLPAKYRESGGSMRADVIVVDPPRKGCDERLLQTIVNMKPQRVVYVSCDPATLARDVKYLAGNGYTLVKAQPVDMFPMTEHVETVVLMSRRTK